SRGRGRWRECIDCSRTSRAEATEIPQCSSLQWCYPFVEHRGTDGVPLDQKRFWSDLGGAPCPASGGGSSPRFSAARRCGQLRGARNRLTLCGVPACCWAAKKPTRQTEHF